MRLRLRALSPLLLLASLACTQTFDAVSLGVPVTMSGAPGEVPAGKPFRVTSHTVHALFGMVTLSQANLRKGLATQLVGADQVAQLKIKTKTRLFDLIISGITLGMILPKTVIYEGVVVGR